MNIGVIGGTQGVGLETVKQAVTDGHSVTLLARTPAKVTLESGNLTIVQGDALVAADVDKIVPGQDVIINSLGSTANNPDNVCTIGTRNIISSMKRFGIDRLLTVTALGVGDSRDQVPFVFKMIMNTVLRKAYADKETQEQAIRGSGLEWVIVRPGGLTDDAKTGSWTVVKSGEKSPGSRISRADVAAFLLTLLEDETYLYEAIGLVA